MNAICLTKLAGLAASAELAGLAGQAELAEMAELAGLAGLAWLAGLAGLARLTGWLAGWLDVVGKAGWLAGRLAGWLVGRTGRDTTVPEMSGDEGITRGLPTAVKRSREVRTTCNTTCPEHRGAHDRENGYAPDEKITRGPRGP